VLNESCDIPHQHADFALDNVGVVAHLCVFENGLHHLHG
jgi:hypothetical protein